MLMVIGTIVALSSIALMNAGNNTLRYLGMFMLLVGLYLVVPEKRLKLSQAY
jgi:hypothetical protein